MLELFYPDEYLDSTYSIDFDTLYEKGYRGIIFDIDNTLVEHGAPATQRSIALFHHLTELGFKTVLLSNNKEPRVKMFFDEIEATAYFYKSNKPMRRGYENAMKRMGTTKENTLFVGDQLFTDVWGANAAGIHSILVKPIDPKEEIQIVIKRRLEWIVLYFYKKHLKKNK